MLALRSQAIGQCGSQCYLQEERGFLPAQSDAVVESVAVAGAPAAVPDTASFF